jgi:hypothetical protein
MGPVAYFPLAAPLSALQTARMPRYSLGTLMILVGVGPPAIAFLWFFWRLVVFLAICIALLSLWVWCGLAMARFLARLLVSVMD